MKKITAFALALIALFACSACFAENDDSVSSSSNSETSSSGVYYGAQHSLVEKEYKEPTCQEEGYFVIGCTECSELDQTTILSTVDCDYEDGKCKWCGKEE